MKKLAIIGAGPIGLEMAVAAISNNIDYYLFEARQIGNTISNWPDNTRFYSAPERIAIAQVPLQKKDQLPLSGDEYLAYLRSVVELYDIKINSYEKVLSIEMLETGFRIKTEKFGRDFTYEAEKVVIATGDMSRTNSLDIPGENLPHVFDNFKDIHRFFQKRVLIIGGRNSALEAAIRCFRVGAEEVMISYRRTNFEKTLVKVHLLKEIELLIDKGQVKFYPGTNPLRFSREKAILKDQDGNEIEVDVDFIIKCVGFRPHLDLLKEAGVTLKGENDEPDLNWETMESNVNGLYVIGTVAKGIQETHRLFIGTCHEHIEKVIRHLTGKDYHKTGAHPKRKYGFDWDDVQYSE